MGIGVSGVGGLAGSGSGFGRAGAVREKWDIVDFLIGVLKEHERALSEQVDRLEALLREGAPRGGALAGLGAGFAGLLRGVLGGEDYGDALWSFEAGGGPGGRGLLVDRLGGRSLVLGGLPGGGLAVDVHEGEGAGGRRLERVGFGGEREMLAWVVGYVGERLRVLVEILG